MELNDPEKEKVNFCEHFFKTKAITKALSFVCERPHTPSSSSLSIVPE